MAPEKIDAHHHFWHYRAEEYPWIDHRMAALQRDFLPPGLAAAREQTGITGAISVQARQSLEETWTLLRFADEHDWLLGVVGWVPFLSGDLNRLLPTVLEHPKLRGLRHVVHDEPDDNFIMRDDFNRGIAAMKPFETTYDILIFERHLPQTLKFVDRHPEQVFVLDHVAKPRIREAVLSPWRENIRELARRPNVYCKLSGMVTEAHWTNWTPADLEPYLEVVFECFGPRRLMFGSDWPVCLVAASYQRWYQVVSEVIGRFSSDEQQRFWSGTAKEAYRL